jgi:hypothetical protein
LDRRLSMVRLIQRSDFSFSVLSYIYVVEKLLFIRRLDILRLSRFSRIQFEWLFKFFLVDMNDYCARAKLLKLKSRRRNVCWFFYIYDIHDQETSSRYLNFFISVFLHQAAKIIRKSENFTDYKQNLKMDLLVGHCKKQEIYYAFMPGTQGYKALTETLSHLRLPHKCSWIHNHFLSHNMTERRNTCQSTWDPLFEFVICERIIPQELLELSRNFKCDNKFSDKIINIID